MSSNLGLIASLCGVGVAAAIGGGVLWCTARRKRKEDNLDDFNGLVSYRGSDGVGTISDSPASPNVPIVPNKIAKDVFLSNEETWERARRCFPNLLYDAKASDYNRIRRVEVVLEDLLKKRLALLQEDEENFERLMLPENAVELCIGLGLDENMVAMRYEAVQNLKKAIGLETKTSTVTSVRHLFHRLGTNNPFGDEADFDGVVHVEYRKEAWLNFLGVKVEKQDANQAVNKVKSGLEMNYKNWSKRPLHGTTGSALQGIFDKEGRLLPTSPDEFKNGIRHDFGHGVYCFKGELEHALSFAIDRCFPLWEEEDQKFTEHNPAIVLFPDAEEFGNKKKHLIYKVGEEKPYKDKYLKEQVLKNKEWEKFQSVRKTWTDDNKHWKEFVKIARWGNYVMAGKKIFHGLLHDCYETHNTDTCKEPVVDEDNWEQYCYRPYFDSPDKYPHLGEKRLFIELNVNWNEWIDSTNDLSMDIARQINEGKQKLHHLLESEKKQKAAKRGT